MNVISVSTITTRLNNVLGSYLNILKYSWITVLVYIFFYFHYDFRLIASLVPKQIHSIVLVRELEHCLTNKLSKPWFNNKLIHQFLLMRNANPSLLQLLLPDMWSYLWHRRQNFWTFVIQPVSKNVVPTNCSKYRK